MIWYISLKDTRYIYSSTVKYYRWSGARDGSKYVSGSPSYWGYYCYRCFCCSLMRAYFC